MTGTQSWLPLHESPSSHWAKDECNWRKSLQHLRHVCTAKPDCDVCSWRAQTSKKHCIEYLHSPPGSTLQSPEAAHLAVLTLPKQLHHQWQHSSVSSSRLFFQWRWSHDPLDEADDPAQNITSLDNIVVQLQKHAEQLEAPWWCYCQHCSPNYYNNTSQIALVQDVCNYIHIKQSQFVLQEEDTLIGRSAKLRCQLYWLAVLCLPRSLYARGPTQGVLHKWLQAILQPLLGCRY